MFSVAGPRLERRRRAPTGGMRDEFVLLSYIIQMRHLYLDLSGVSQRMSLSFAIGNVTLALERATEALTVTSSS